MRNLFVGNTELFYGTAVDTVVHVSCIARPEYPSWMGRVIHPELQNTGPSQYDLRTDVTPWRHDRQKDGKDLPSGEVVYDYLEKRDEIDSCLGLVDRAEIKKMGAQVFCEIFGDEALLFFPRSMVEDRSEISHVPFLFVFNNEVRDGWYWLGGYWQARYLTLRFN